jgi:protein tyrosine/serine phosphatase
MEREFVGPKFTSMPNFRELGREVAQGGGGPRDLIQEAIVEDERPIKLYRSSRPDFLTAEEVVRFRELGIKSIIDFRSNDEYRKATGNKLLDAAYPVYKVKLPFSSSYRAGDQIKYVPVRARGNKVSPPTSSEHSQSETSDEKSGAATNEPVGKHLLINFFKIQYGWAVFCRAPWYIQLYALLHLIVDLVLRTGYRYFVRVFARYVLNKEGLVGQYFDMLEHSQSAICAALKLLSDPANVPAMLNCAHGKDRTGIVSALVLSCLGRSKEYVAADYARSEPELEAMHERLCEEIINKFHMCRTFTSAKYETMMQVLDYIDERYGNVENYLESLAFTRDDQQRLRNNLTL